MTTTHPKTRMVADSNYLARPQLAEFLAASSLHFVVLTEFASIEAYKGDTLRSIFPSMAVLQQFPKQVIVLKGSQLTSPLVDSVSNPQLRLIDSDQTAGFPGFCQALTGPISDHVKRDLLSKGRLASTHMDRMVRDAEGLARSLPEVLSIYDEGELRTLRKQEGLEPLLARKVMQQVMVLSAVMLKSAQIHRVPSFDELLDTLVFRESLCIYIWALRTLQGTSPTNPARIRNDMVDSSFAAYATFFDGLLSADALPNTIYATAMNWMSTLKKAK